MSVEFLKVFGLVYLTMISLRLYEMYVSKNNEKKLLENFSVKLLQPMEHHFVYIFHVLWFIALLSESLYRNQIQDGMLSILCYGLLTFAQVIRFESMQTLGIFWTTKIYDIPVKNLVFKGIYRYLAHPSYLAVVIEFIVLPMLFNAYYTLVIFSIINVFILAYRMNLESRVTGRMI